jgi:hypothetical protein
MRGFKQATFVSDVLSVLAIAALVTVVHLCSLPQSVHSPSARKADAAELLIEAQDHLNKEGALFSALVGAHDWNSADELRQALHDNERRFHVLTAAVAEKLPEAGGDIEAIITDFDSLSAAGWQAEKAVRRDAPMEAVAVMQSRFFPVLEELRGRTQAIGRSLHLRDIHDERSNPAPYFDQIALHFT